MEETVQKRLEELAQRAYHQGTYTFSHFLDLAALSTFHRLRPALPPVPATLFGGCEGCERQMVRFGSPAFCGYDQPFPIVVLLLSPTAPKFADALTHRDFLGALMALGIERELLGDIVVRDNQGYLFCEERIAPYLMENLTQAKHTPLTCAVADTLPDGPLFQTRRQVVQLASPRLDALIAHVHALSRSDAQALFPAGKVFVDGRLCENPGYPPKEGEILSVRGLGRMKYLGVDSLSKKGKSNTAVERYI